MICSLYDFFQKKAMMMNCCLDRINADYSHAKSIGNRKKEEEDLN